MNKFAVFLTILVVSVCCFGQNGTLTHVRVAPTNPPTVSCNPNTGDIISNGAGWIYACQSTNTWTQLFYANGMLSGSQISGNIAGSTITGNIPGLSSGFTGTLTGDVQGTQNTTLVVGINGTSVPTNNTPDQILLTTAGGTGTWTSIPNCSNDNSHALIYSTTSHTFSCQTITGGGGGGGGSSVSINGSVLSSTDFNGNVPSPDSGFIAGTFKASGSEVIVQFPFGIGSTTFAVGNDSRIVGALQSSSNLGDVSSPSVALGNLGGLTKTLANGSIFVGNGSTVASPVAVSGDATLANTGALTVTKTNGVSFATVATSGSYVDLSNKPSFLSGTLTSAFMYVGNGSNSATGVAMSGDCTLSNTGAVNCTKTGGTSFVASATTDTTSASNISSGTLNLSRLALATADIYVGSVGGAPAAIALNGDCTLTSTGLVTCTKTSGALFVASATIDTTNASNISGGTLSTSRLPAVVNITTGFQIGGVAASRHFLVGNGTNYIDGTIQVSDVPTLNQSTTGNASTASALATTPSQCSGTDYSTGIAANGNSNCSPLGTSNMVGTGTSSVNDVIVANNSGSPLDTAIDPGAMSLPNTTTWSGKLTTSSSNDLLIRTNPPLVVTIGGTYEGMWIQGSPIDATSSNVTAAVNPIVIGQTPNAVNIVSGNNQTGQSVLIGGGANTGSIVSNGNPVPGDLNLLVTGRVTSGTQPTGNNPGCWGGADNVGLTGHNTLQACASITAQQNMAGIEQASIGSYLSVSGQTQYLVDHGKQTVNSATSQAWTAGDTVCTDPANVNDFIDVGSARCKCPSTQIGVNTTTNTGTFHIVQVVAGGGACVPEVEVGGSDTSNQNLHNFTSVGTPLAVSNPSGGIVRYTLTTSGNGTTAVTSNGLAGIAGTVTCDDGIGNLTDSGCSGGGSSTYAWTLTPKSSNYTITAADFAAFPPKWFFTGSPTTTITYTLPGGGSLPSGSSCVRISSLGSILVTTLNPNGITLNNNVGSITLGNSDSVEVCYDAASTNYKLLGVSSNLALPSGVTTTTQTALDNSTKVATTAYVDAAVTSGSTVPFYDSGDITYVISSGTTTGCINGAGGTTIDTPGSAQHYACELTVSQTTTDTCTTQPAFTNQLSWTDNYSGTAISGTSNLTTVISSGGTILGTAETAVASPGTSQVWTPVARNIYDQSGAAVKWCLNETATIACTAYPTFKVNVRCWKR